MSNLPAILGGAPAFRTRANIVRPLLPEFSDLSEDTQKILNSGMVTKGQYLAAFEEAVAQHLGVKYAIAVSSCTAGLMLTYNSLDLTGEVLVPSFTFMATVGAMMWCGLKPVYVDVKAETTNIDPQAVEAAITPQTSAIVAVHNFGNPAEIEALEKIAGRHGLKLIFDAAHGFGALYRGKPVGGQGNAQVFSMSPTKLLITGEGGLVATNDAALAEQIRIGREYGNSGSYDSAFAGLNARLPEFNALLGINSLKMLEEAACRRNETAAQYLHELGQIEGLGFQEIHPEDRCSYKDFSITIDADAFGLTRDQLALALGAENIDTRKYYDPPVHRQTAYARFYTDPLPHTEWLADNSLSLPMWSNMSTETAGKITTAVRLIHANADAIQRKLA